jgi:hypothetical protein
MTYTLRPECWSNESTLVAEGMSRGKDEGLVGRHDLTYCTSASLFTVHRTEHLISNPRVGPHTTPSTMISSRNSATASARIISRAVQRANRVRLPATTSHLAFRSTQPATLHVEQKNTGSPFGVRGYAAASGTYFFISLTSPGY